MIARLDDESIAVQTVLCEGEVAGYLASFEQCGHPSVSYWIGRAYWGRGVATSALSKFVRHVKERPLYARAAKDNAGSIRVLEKCGFVSCGEDKMFSNARGIEVDELVLRLH